MDFGLRGKRALVTGSTAGIGFAASRALAREGAHVVVNGRTLGAGARRHRSHRAGLHLQRVGTAHPVEMIHYGVTKTAQIALARGLAESLASTGVTVIIQRFATIDEVAAMIAFVCGERASATTGAALRVDGGVVLAIP